MKKQVLYLLATACVLTGLSSCKKDDSTAPTPTKTDMLTAKTWKITEVKVANQSVFNPPFFAACNKDDLTKFSANKAATFDEGSLKCDPTAPQSRTGSWDLTTNETKLKITDPDGAVLEGTIGTLSSTTLVITDPNAYGTGVAAEITYTAQ